MSGTSAGLTDRFSVTMKKTEIQEIADYSASTGVPRNELIRRATIALIRLRQGKGKDIERLFQQVGSIDEPEATPL